MFEFDVNNIFIVDRLSLNQLSEITEKLELGAFIEADKQIESVFSQDKIWDSRYLFYYLFSQLAQYKFVNYINFARHSIELFSENYEFISPSHRKDKIVQKAIDWFERYFIAKFEQVLKLFPAEEKIGNVCQITIDLLDSISQHGYETKKIQIKMSKFVGDTLKEFTPVQMETNQVSREESIICQNHAQEDSSCLKKSNINSSSVLDKIAPNPNVVSFDFSMEWERLINLLQDYDYYMESGHVEVAYLSHLKIEEMMANFNPTLYFPKIFKSYLRSKVHNYAKLHALGQQNIESLPYANLINEILVHHDSSLRKMICEKPFEYLTNDESLYNVNSDIIE